MACAVQRRRFPSGKIPPANFAPAGSNLSNYGGNEITEAFDVTDRFRWSSKEMVIYAGSINRDHVHMLAGIPPHISVSRAVQYLKGRSSHKLLSEYRQLRKRYWGQHLWARGYSVATSGNVTDEVWKEYIKNQTPPEPDDDFHVV